MSASRRAADVLRLGLLTIGAVLVHGYHPGVEDAEIYLPGVLKRLQPGLFPHDPSFFESHASLTAFPWIIASSVRATGLPVGIVVLCWHVVSVFALLLACWKIARLCFRTPAAVWSGVALVAVLLTIPVAGTSLYLVDQYVTSRSFSTPMTLLAVASAAERRPLAASAWLAATALVHPLMTAFAAAYLVVLAALDRYEGAPVAAAAAVPFADLFRPVSPAYHQVLETRPLHLVTNWRWYEWLGVVAPLALLAWFERIGRRRQLGPMAWLCRGLIVLQVICTAIAWLIAVPGRYEQWSELQPMRALHLLYILLFVFAGGLMGEAFLRRSTWRWVALFVPLCGGMWIAQRQLFPDSPHLEWPWRASPNAWVQAFDWIRTTTPVDAYFALDPDHMVRPGEDQHGFRAIAQRSMLADRVKDSGAASMFPALAERWLDEVGATAGWRGFGVSDFERLRRRYGVTWVVVEQPGASGLTCPYENARVRVCRLL